MRASLALLLLCGCVAAAESAPAEEPVSYAAQVRPILQAHCTGCHQPAKRQGDYDLTTTDAMRAAGESGERSIVPGDPGASYLMAQIAVHDGVAEMPKNGAPLAAGEIELMRRWIAEGAAVDEVRSGPVYTPDSPPMYTRPPVVTSLDHSPDGTLLAVAGFHEVLLREVATGDLVGRLVGASERVESVRFSPDGGRLAVTGGLPGRAGEVQVWDVKTRELLLSVPVTADTVYGASWSPEGTRIAFGGADNSVRVIEADTGKQVLFQGSHGDWVLDTTFSRDGKHLVSVGRDMTAKLTEVASERFIDNVTSITPGALKGGITSVAAHPDKDAMLTGDASGGVKIYRLFRNTKRVIGDDANLVRDLPPLPGRVFAVDLAGDRYAAVSSDAGRGVVGVSEATYAVDMPEEIKTVSEKRVEERSDAEKKALDDFHKQEQKTLANIELPTPLYAVSFAPDGQSLAVAGGDGVVRILAADGGEVLRQFAAVPLTAVTADVAETAAKPAGAIPQEVVEKEPIDAAALSRIVRMTVEPAAVEISGPFDTVQLLVTGHTAEGAIVDLTRTAEIVVGEPLVAVGGAGRLSALADGQTELTATVGPHAISVPVSVATADAPPVDYVRDVMPVLSKAGCNSGTCHGSKDGKNGFKLSLRGYDPVYDVRAFGDDLRSRRMSLASPEDSLMLLKATGQVAHVGGQRMKVGSPYYEVLRRWIAAGATLEPASPRVTAIAVSPKDPVVADASARQQMRIVATYADGQTRDVTAEAFVESGNTDVAAADERAVVTTLRRGEAPVLARFEGAYAATTVTVMGDRSGFVWTEPSANNFIDDLVAAKLQRTKTLASPLCDDADFLRRVHLDLTGLPPTPEAVSAFLADERPTRVKRDAVIDDLVGNDAFVDYWTNKWADLLQVNGKFLAREGATAFRDWIREQVAANLPYDQFARQVLTASGSNRDNPPAAYYKILREPAALMENTTHLFLGVRFNCNKCHDHPFERWTQDQYYQTAAFFAQVDLKADPQSGKRTVGGTAVEGAKPLYEIVADNTSGEVAHDRTGAVTAPQFPFEADFPEAGAAASRRERLAGWLTGADNRYFASSYVNRVWGYLTGTGLIEPIDDIRAGNPPTNPQLLAEMTDLFVASGFDVRLLMRTICKSHAYQRSIATNEWNEDDRVNYSHAKARRLPAEVLYDAVHRVTGAEPDFPGVPKGTRAAQLPDAGIELPSGFLANLGKPPRESACECERSSDLQLGPVMALISGPTVADAINDDRNALTALVGEVPDDGELIDRVFRRILSRPATTAEVAAGIELLTGLQGDHEHLRGELAAYEASLPAETLAAEAARTQAVAAAQTAVAARQREIAPARAEAEKQRQERIAAAKKVRDMESNRSNGRLAAWEKSRNEPIGWQPLAFTRRSASNGATTEVMEDGSVFVGGEQGKGVYELVAAAPVGGADVLRLEAMADDRLPMKGPGRAPNGNLVVSELEILVAPADRPDQLRPLKLAGAQATYAQGGFAAEAAIDGMTDAGNNGWALMPQLGKTHEWLASFAEPVPVGSRLVIKLHQNFPDGLHALGRFRISLAARDLPLWRYGIPEAIAKILEVPAAERNAKQKRELAAAFRMFDRRFAAAKDALAAAEQPLPADADLTKLQAALAAAEAVPPPDAQLTRLRSDVALSAEQLTRSRLTGVQDLAWALVNSPAFLFNH